MKNQLIYLLIILGMALGFSSCASDDLLNPADVETGLVHIDVEIPSGELRTRGYGDGNSISNIKCYVYSVGAEIPMRTENVTITSANGKRGGSLGIDLPSGGAYDFVFLATSCPQDDKNSKVYYNPSDRTVNLNYSKITGNDEGVDCFFGVLPSISIDKGQSHSVTLKRPFAQLNIGTKDLDIYNKMASAPLATVGVSVDGVYTTMNVMDGECFGETTKVTLAPAAVPSGQTFPVKDVSYLAMDYLLVKDRRDVAVSLSGSNGSSSFTSLYEDIPLQRNYQTVLYGNLLTAEKDFTVEINPEFAASGNLNVDDPYDGYDLVLKVGTMRIDETPLVVRYKDGRDSIISLRPYWSASDLMVKLTWDELGIKDVTNIRFCKDEFSYNSIISFIKCDIEKLGITDLSYILYHSTSLNEAPAIKNWDTKKITNMSHMFALCRQLNPLDVSYFDTSNVTDMSGMFFSCYEIQELDISGFDTSKVTDMSRMFEDCQKLKELHLSSFDTSKVTDMSGMFASCQLIKELDLSSFDTSKVTDMSQMFRKTNSLQTLDLSSFDTSHVTDMHGMFGSCNVSTLDLSNFVTSNVTNMKEMFINANISTFNISTTFDTSHVTDMYGMFQECKNLKNLNLTQFDTSSVTDMARMFEQSSSIRSINLSSFNTSKVTDMHSMFIGCSDLTDIDISSFDTSKVSNMSSMFQACTRLTALDLSSFNTSNVTRMDWLVGNCPNLKTINLSSFNTSNVTNMSSMFKLCKRLNPLDVTNFDTSKVTDMSYMFNDCTALKELDLSNFDMTNVTNKSYWLTGCNATIIGL